MLDTLVKYQQFYLYYIAERRLIKAKDDIMIYYQARLLTFSGIIMAVTVYLCKQSNLEHIYVYR